MFQVQAFRILAANITDGMNSQLPQILRYDMADAWYLPKVFHGFVLSGSSRSLFFGKTKDISVAIQHVEFPCSVKSLMQFLDNLGPLGNPFV